MLNIYIGYDAKEVAAYQICAYSIQRNSSEPVSISPINIRHLPWFTNTDYKASTDFAFTRFLVPYLSNFKGWSLFMDSDVLVRSDIVKLFDFADNRYAVMCVKHDYQPKEGNKFLNQQQTQYQKKNWSSVMLFNNAKCKTLSAEYVNRIQGLALHTFNWCEDDEIGELPKSWNHLVGEYETFTDADLVHFTLGGPYFNQTANCEYSQQWLSYWKEANSVLDVILLGVENV